MMDHKIVLRTTSNLSFAGEVVRVNLDGEEGIFLRPSDNSNIKIWCTKDEVKNILLPDGREVTMEGMKDEFGFK